MKNIVIVIFLSVVMGGALCLGLLVIDSNRWSCTVYEDIKITRINSTQPIPDIRTQEEPVCIIWEKK